MTIFVPFDLTAPTRAHDGYVRIRCPQHPKQAKGEVLLHRLIMENNLGRFLRSNEVVHHLDGNGLNNALENLVLTNTTDHHRLYHRSDPPTRVCPQCKQRFIVTTHNWHKYSTQRYCGSTCREKARGEAIAQKIKQQRNAIPHKGKSTHCVICGKSVNKKSKRYCSQTCVHIGQQQAVRPSPGKLRRLVWSMPTSEVAKLFGVTDVAIAKWCKSLGVEKPPRGYWEKMKASKTKK